MTSALCIINFHGLGTPHDGVDADEARYWVDRDRFRKILDKIMTHQANGRQIKVTFDDGNRSDIEIAVPELRKRSLTGHFFVLTGRCADPCYLSESEIRSLAHSDMRVGLHGRNHVDWRQVDDTTLYDETFAARDKLAKITGVQVDTVAVPFGGYDRRVVNKLKCAGFKEIYTSDGGLTSDARRLRHRTSVRADMSDAVIDAALAGRESVTERLKRGLKTVLKEHLV